MDVGDIDIVKKEESCVSHVTVKEQIDPVTHKHDQAYI